MTTSVLDRVPVEHITERARQVKFSVTLLRLLAGLLFALGWALAKATGVLWLALAWSAIAFQEGWRAGRQGGTRGPAGTG